MISAHTGAQKERGCYFILLSSEERAEATARVFRGAEALERARGFAAVVRNGLVPLGDLLRQRDRCPCQKSD